MREGERETREERREIATINVFCRIHGDDDWLIGIGNIFYISAFSSY